MYAAISTMPDISWVLTDMNLARVDLVHVSICLSVLVKEVENVFIEEQFHFG
jgi:hypothetical protein